MTQIEGSFLYWIQNSVRTPLLNEPMRIIGSLADYGIFWIALALALIIIKRTRRAGVTAGISVLLTFILVNGILKNIFQRARPYETFEYIHPIIKAVFDTSFPSGHASNSFAGSTALLLAWSGTKNKKYGVLLVILAALISLSRMYVGVHYPSDVIAGAACGILTAFAARHIVNRLPEKITGKIGIQPGSRNS